jgi:hypothetical protein
MHKIVITLILYGTLSISGCSVSNIKDQNSYLYSVPVGSTLSLNKTITIPANLARRFFQGGKQMLEKDINIYYPYCSLLMNTLTDVERTIKPIIFEVYKVQDDEETARRYVYFASNLLSSSDGPSIIGYASYYYLRSTSAPDVRSLECMQWGDPVDVEYLSINEVKKALGDYFTLILKQ